GVSFMVSGWRSDGVFARGTAGAGHNYFLCVGYRPNADHNLNFMVFGAPHWHDQNYSKPLESVYRDGILQTPGYDMTGIKGNSNYGWYQGEGLSQRRNFYHKPVANLNWDWRIDESSSLSTVLYASVGRGGGTGTLGNGPGFIPNGYDTETGFTNWDVIAEQNQQLPGGYSQGYNGTVLRASANNHFWYGLVSNYSFEPTTNWTFNVGADLRFYQGDHFQQLVNLLGTNGRIESNVNRPDDYVVDQTFSTNPWSVLFNSASVEERVGYDNSEKINYQGLFGQIEYADDVFSSFIQASVSNQSYQKMDRWGYQGEAKSGFDHKLGFNIKGGASYTIEQQHTLFANIGYYSRQPFLDNVFVFNTVDFADPAVDNEKI